MGYALTLIIGIIILLNELNCLGIHSFEKIKPCFLIPINKTKFDLNVGGNKITEEGCVIQSMGGTTFQVETKMEKKILCELSGRMKVNRIRIDIGNMVVVEMNPRYPTRGRIIERLTNRFYKHKTFGVPRQLQHKNRNNTDESSESEDEDFYEDDDDDDYEIDELV